MGPTPAGGVGGTSLPSASLRPFRSSAPPPPPQRFLQTHVVEEEVSDEARAALGPRLPQHTTIDQDNHHQNELMQINSKASLGCPQGLGAGHWVPFYQQVHSTWSKFYTSHHKVQQYPWHSFENFYPVGGQYPLLVDNRVQFSPLNLYSQGYPPEVLIQEFQYFVVVDFEATCDKGKNPQPQEIIEFPSVLVNSATGQLEASFQTYVRPIYHQHLTDFCKELTGIQQIQVDRGVPITEALLMHDKWLEDKGIKNTNFAVVTWSDWDCHVMLESECKLKRIRKPPYFNRWINIKIPFQEVFGNVRCNLKEAVQLAGLTWEGRAHCGLDDALNTARLLSTLMHHGIKFSITNSLTQQPADCPMEACPPHLLCKSGPIIQLPMPKQPAEPVIQFHPHSHPPPGEKDAYCFCGVISSKCMVRKPGPKHGSYFFGCGNWTATRGAVCHYFEWAS